MKIFGIGLSRTGTMSLHNALIILGYRSHFIYEGEENLSGSLSKFDAFTHLPLVSVYKELDQRFPNSKFILTVRKDRESWLNSCEKNMDLVIVDIKTKSEDLRKILRNIYGTEEFNRELYSIAYDRHYNDVIKHFSERENDLLILDICGGEGFEKLCSFLGKPNPTQPFPQKNSISKFRGPCKMFKRFMIKRLKARQINQYIMRYLRS